MRFFLAGFFFRSLTFCDSLSLGFSSILQCPAFSVHLLRLGNITHIHVKCLAVKIHLRKMGLDNVLNLRQLGVKLIVLFLMRQPCARRCRRLLPVGNST